MAENEKICKNCKFYHKHYTGNSKVSFVFANNVCVYQMPVYVKEKHYCGYWEEREENEENEENETD